MCSCRLREVAYARSLSLSFSLACALSQKCLGIPNTKPFQGITLIEDAYTLWAKLKAEGGSTTFNPDFDEEFEDTQGNVMNRKIYTDLARQGLLD